MAVQGEGLDELRAGLATSDDLEGEDGTGSLGCVLVRERLRRAVLERGPLDGLDLRVTVEEVGDPPGVLEVPLDAQAERLETLREEEGVERGDGRADVAQELDTGLEDVRQVGAEGAANTEVRAVAEAVVALVREVVVRELLRVLRVVELPAVHDDTRDDGAVPAEVLRRRVDDDVGTVL